MSKVWGNTLVKNEDRFLWFAVSSVINYLDKLLIWDTGSTDKTVEVINKLREKYPGKIEFKQYGPVDEDGFTRARQEMLNQTKSDWLLILDGDEVWWEDSIKKVRETIEKKGDKLFAIVTPFKNAIGDIYHFQDESAGNYNILNRKGHLTIRAINRKIPDLRVDRPYGSEGFFGGDTPVQNLDQSKLLFLEAPFLHLTHLQRSSRDLEVMQRENKLKYELGNSYPKNIRYPEVFDMSYPAFIESPFKKRERSFVIRASIETPLKKIKRKIYG